MKDIVLKNIVDNFATEHDLTNFTDSEVFECFATSLLLRRFHDQDIADIRGDLVVGGGQDGGIDAVAILVNGCLVRSIAAVDDFKPGLHVEFVFVQAKTSSKFSATDIGSFSYGVEQFFTSKRNRRIPLSPELTRLADIAEYIFSQFSLNFRENPQCSLYFVTSGIWEEPQEPMARLVDGQKRLTEMNLFKEVAFRPIGSQELRDIHRDLKFGIRKQVTILDPTVFPTIDNVEQAYIGLISGDQFIELVSTENRLNRDLFYYNVRDFQGHTNPVNQDIGQTLEDDTRRKWFPLLNNGVTIVARHLNRTGNSFTLSDFQIVNGCQTTYLLAMNQPVVDSTVSVPIKVLVTKDSDIIAEVIKATNRQTDVPPITLESLSEFHKDLEEYYVAEENRVAVDDRIYYERRSKQYHDYGIGRSQIVGLEDLIRSFVAMFLNEPHRFTTTPNTLLEGHRSRLFIDEHRPGPYYASGVALRCMERLAKLPSLRRKVGEENLQTIVKHYKPHVLMLLRMQISGETVPDTVSHSVDDYSLKIVRTLRDSRHGVDQVERAIKWILEIRSSLIASQRRRTAGDAEFGDDPEFTERLITSDRQAVVGRGGTSRIGEIESGVVRSFDYWRGFGFINVDDEDGARGEPMFFHRSQLGETPVSLVHKGMRVRYTVIKGKDGRPQAGDVEPR